MADNLLSDSISKASFSMGFYLYDMFEHFLTGWRETPHNNCTTWAEASGISRSECHARSIYLSKASMKDGEHMNNSKELKTIIELSDNIVFFGGAGVSTESGIPDFRSRDGLYNQKYKFRPEEILSHTFFERNPEEFFIFYKDKMNCLKYEPNVTHKVLASLEKRGKLKAVVTQNIDGLHQKAGSEKVYELHGSVLRNYCMKCGKFHSAEYVFDSAGSVPRCECGGVIKPDVVLYEESLDTDVINGAVNAIAAADCLIVAGTSLTVYPASGMINYYKGNKLVLINRDATPYDNRANVVIHDSLGNVFKDI